MMVHIVGLGRPNMSTMVNLLRIVIWLLQTLGVTKSGTHSVWMMATYIKGETPFPEFSVYLTLDDVVILHFDSEEAEISHIDTHEGSGTKFNAEELSYFRTYVNGSLKNSASYLKNHFNDSKVKPRIRLLQKTLGSEGIRVTCLATGFYPRHINLTLLRDGQPVPDHQITGGELLPNGDETYQMRKSLEVSTEELQQHHYKCTAQHLSLDNKLDIDLESERNSVATPIVSATVVTVFVCLVGACGAYM
ncbi:major histocompatibility complex class I-related gene protein-like [Engraulis encrasicolus]|uniref:major histocompatibility complex class I-related gene protein-like n=1 Tax=Engraulis encrasicolus TaxID=184585 RepID=UPI002FD1A9CC